MTFSSVRVGQNHLQGLKKYRRVRSTRSLRLPRLGLIREIGIGPAGAGPLAVFLELVQLFQYPWEVFPTKTNPYVRPIKAKHFGWDRHNPVLVD